MQTSFKITPINRRYLIVRTFVNNEWVISDVKCSLCNMVSKPNPNTCLYINTFKYPSSCFRKQLCLYYHPTHYKYIFVLSIQKVHISILKGSSMVFCHTLSCSLFPCILINLMIIHFQCHS